MHEIDRLRRLVDLPVELVAWPGDERLRTALARAGVPRLLLVAPDSSLPADLGVDEDWVRLPAGGDDVVQRAQQLVRVADRLEREAPFIDDARVLHRGGMAVPLTATASAILAVLLERRGTVVSADELAALVWPGAAPSHDAVHRAVTRLRRRLAGLHLVVRSVRKAGFVIDAD